MPFVAFSISNILKLPTDALCFWSSLFYIFLLAVTEHICSLMYSEILAPDSKLLSFLFKAKSEIAVIEDVISLLIISATLDSMSSIADKAGA